MPSAAYSFIDVAVLDGVRERFAAGDAIVILSADLTEVVWANGPGAALFGHADIEQIVGAESGLGFAARRQIMATKGFPDIGRDRTIMVRLAQGMSSRAVAFAASAIALPDGEEAILLAVPAGLAGAPETEIAARAISGFTEPGHMVAFLDGQGKVEAASPDFFARGVPAEVLAALVADVAGEDDRLVKKIISTGPSRLPAGIARLRDHPARHLLVMIDEDTVAEEVSATAGETPAAMAQAEPAAAETTATELPDAGIDDAQAVASQADAAETTAPAEPVLEAAEPAATVVDTDLTILDAAQPAEPAAGPVNAEVAEEATAVEETAADAAADDHPVPSIDDIREPQDPNLPAEPAQLLTPAAIDAAADGVTPEPIFEAMAREPQEQVAAEELRAASDAEAEFRPAVDAAEEESAAPREPVVAKTVTVDRNAAPVRFVWKTDAAGRFSAVSPEFLESVGATSGDVLGRPFSQISDALRLDPQREIAGLLERRDTWSGRSVFWPIAGTDLKVPVDLAALPSYSRDRTFEGFRGFGVARLADSVVDLDAVGLTLGAAAAPAPVVTKPAEPPVEIAGPQAEPKAEEPRGDDPFQGEVPALSVSPRQDRRSSDKIIRLAEHRPASVEKSLSNVERSAFREIGERLKKSGGIEDLPQAGNANGARQSDIAADVETAVTAANDSVAAAEKASVKAGETVAVEGAESELHATLPETVSAEAAAIEATVDLTTEETGAPTSPGLHPSQTAVAHAIAESTEEPTTDLVATDGITAEAGSEHPAHPEQLPDLTTRPQEAPEAVAPDTIVVKAGEPSVPLPDTGRFQPGTDPAWQELRAQEAHAGADTVSVGGSQAGSSASAAGLVASTEASFGVEPAQPAWQEAPAHEAGADTVLVDASRAEPSEQPASTVEIVDGNKPSLGAAPPQEIFAHDAPADADTVSIDGGTATPSDLPVSVTKIAGGDEPSLDAAPAPQEIFAHEAYADADTISIGDSLAEPSNLPASVTKIVDDEEPTPEPAPVSDAVEADVRAISPVAAARAAIAELKTAGFMPSAFSSSPDSGKRFQDTAILSRLPVPLLIHSGDVLHYANDEFLTLTGYASLDDIRDAGGLGALFSDRYEEAKDEAGRSLRMRTADGMEFPIEALLRSVPWSGGHALMLVVRRTGDAVEVSNEEAPQPQQPDVEALKARVSEMRAIIDTATDGVILITHDGMIRSISRPAEALFGFETDEISGKPFISLFAMESQRAARDYLNGLSDHGVASVLNDGREVIGRESQGRFIPLFMTIGKLPNDSGFCAVVRDITQWKRAEEELTQARSVAERASSQKSDFLARISHEIRTPLNAIIGFSELMIDERFGAIGNDRYRDYLRDINRSGNHVLELVNDLLDISKIEAGEQEMAYEAVSLNETLGQTVAMMQPQANRERVIIRSSFASRLPDIVADARSVRQIALNLLSNAVRYTQAGGQVIVSTAYEPSGDVVMRVRDTGIGMTQAEIEQALKPFKQINALKRSRGDGTGLGLPLTKAMVEANRARFTINSTPGEGTLVEVTFPSTRVLAN
ncbi:ATP-binding protein [Mesorhizobium sp. ASY16-5R]|uniref:PAS domain-containing sensor histidine kinase n=1 Tax=Mesorhizobium sp. ASY16-5R TaxID=3445772 RepID=UPI003FA0C10C